MYFMKNCSVYWSEDMVVSCIGDYFGTCRLIVNLSLISGSDTSWNEDQIQVKFMLPCHKTDV